MPNQGTQLIAFRAGDLLAHLDARTYTSMADSVSEVAKRDLDRYYDMLARSLPTFTVAEASLICDALNGSLLQPASAPLLWAEISDALDDGLAEKWGVDGPALVARLRLLTPFQALAVEDAVERWWRSTRDEPDLSHEERHRRVGLVK